jgi:DNA-binding NarL/FixJ family response regulator
MPSLAGLFFSSGQKIEICSTPAASPRMTMPKNIKVLIAEDHKIVREGLKILISSDPQIRIAGEAEDGEKAVKLAKKLRPDVVLMDLAMPRSNGLQATREICRQVPRTKVLVLSAYQDPESIRKAMEVGASGYLTKRSAANDLLTAIREVQRGNRYYSPCIAARLDQQLRSSFLHGHRGATPRPLTKRENQVLVLIAQGLANKGMAAQLSLSVKTIEKHRQQVMDKLDIHEVAGLTRYALSKGLLPGLAPAPSTVPSPADIPIAAPGFPRAVSPHAPNY